jgi:hypothetical protein
MASATPSKTELLEKLAEIEHRASLSPGTLDPAEARAAEAELRTLFPSVCAAAGVPLEEAEESPPWFPPQVPTRAYLLQNAHVFMVGISLAEVTGPAKVVSEAKKSAFETLKAVVAFMRGALM